MFDLFTLYIPCSHRNPPAAYSTCIHISSRMSAHTQIYLFIYVHMYGITYRIMYTILVSMVAIHIYLHLTHAFIDTLPNICSWIDACKNLITLILKYLCNNYIKLFKLFLIFRLFIPFYTIR